MLANRFFPNGTRPVYAPRRRGFTYESLTSE
jgi:hypothetical protein